MAKFHIVITDNETGETLKDADACAIIGACNEGEYSAGIVLSECNTIDLLHALRAASASIDKCLEGEPVLRVMYEVAKGRPLEKVED